MRLNKISVSVFFLLYFTTNAFTQNVRVVFINKTDKNIDSLFVNGAFIGQLKPDSSSKVITYESLSFDSSGNEVRGTCRLDQQPVKSWSDFVFCGTGPFTEVREGDFRYNITSRYIDSREYISFDPKR